MKSLSNATLIKEYHQFLLSSAYKLCRDETTCHDLCSETWETYFKNPSNFQSQSKLKSYLYGILKNKYREHYRKQTKTNFKELSLEDVMESDFDNGNFKQSPRDPLEIMTQLEDRKQLSICINKLKESYKSAFVLKEINSTNKSEICENLNISMKNLNVILFRAKNKLRECLIHERKK